MMGERRVMQEALFYSFSLERHVPDTRSATPQFERAYRLAISPRLAWTGWPDHCGDSCGRERKAPLTKGV
jgi:hypothetical protein